MSRCVFIVMILIGVAQASCVKDKTIPPATPPVYDSIFPRDYFPAWPGSFWVYDHTDTVRVKDNYELKAWEDGPGVLADSAWVPVIAEYECQVREYDLVGSVDEPYLAGHIVANNEAEGKEWDDLVTETAFRTNKIVNKDTSITIDGKVFSDVLVVRSSNGDGSPDPEHPFAYAEFRYYAKDIGLIKMHYRTFPEFVLVTTELTEYHVNN